MIGVDSALMVFSYNWSESQIHMLVLYAFWVDKQVFLCREEERENVNNFFKEFGKEF